MFPLIPKVSPSSNTKKSFFQLSALDHELLSTLKVTTFPADSLPKFHSPFASNAISRPLYTH